MEFGMEFGLKRFKNASLSLKKRFKLGLSFIGRLFLEKMDAVYSPARISKMVQNRQKVKVNPFGDFLAKFETFFKVHFLEKYTCNEASNEPKNAF